MDFYDTKTKYRKEKKATVAQLRSGTVQPTKQLPCQNRWIHLRYLSWLRDKPIRYWPSILLPTIPSTITCNMGAVRSSLGGGKLFPIISVITEQKCFHIKSIGDWDFDSTMIQGTDVEFKKKMFVFYWFCLHMYIIIKWKKRGKTQDRNHHRK